MSTEPQKFRKKPVEIEAMQFTGPAESATPIIDWSDNLVARLRAYREHGVGGLAAQAMVEAADRIEALGADSAALVGQLFYAWLTMRAERDAALAKVTELEGWKASAQ